MMIAAAVEEVVAQYSKNDIPLDTMCIWLNFDLF